MSHPSGASSIVSPTQPSAKVEKKPIVGETRIFHDHNGEPSFEVKFMKDAVQIKRVGQPDITRKIVPKYGNVRAVEGYLKQVSDQVAWHLFNLKENT